MENRKFEFESPLSEADGLLAESGRLQEMLKEKDDLQKEIDAVAASRKSLSEIAGLAVDFSHLSSESLQFILLKCNPDKAKQAASAISARKNFALASAPAGSGSYVLLIALPKGEDAKFLEQFGQAMPLPSISSTPASEISRLAAKEKKLREELASAVLRLEKFAEKHYAKLLAVEESLQIEADRAEIATMFGGTESLYFIEGWAESSRVAQLESELQKKFGKRVHVSEAAIDEHHDSPPTKLQNPSAAGPFQYLVEFLSTPNYSEIDPTLLMLVFVPIIYALIFGDAGYAMISALLSYKLVSGSKKGTLLHEISLIWLLSSLPAFLAGVAFDEWFGFTHQHLLSVLGMPHVQLYSALLHRVESINVLMLITIIFGMAHIGIGFLLGAMNEWGHSRKHAIAKLCWLGIEISGFFLVAAGMFGAFPFMLVPAGALFGISLAGLVWSEGPIAAFEIPGLGSNIMSYIRIAAVGVGGVILAEAINELLVPKLELSPIGIVMFLITAVLYAGAHLAACVLAMFESFVHGARLNVVEFFGKFYRGNGRKFSPFSATRQYTEEA